MTRTHLFAVVFAVLHLVLPGCGEAPADRRLSAAGDAGLEATAFGSRICGRLVPMAAACVQQPFSLEECTSMYDQAVARGCKATYLEAFAHFMETSGTFDCVDNGSGPSLDANSDDESVLIGILCPITVSDRSCRAISCRYDNDCGAEQGCNDATHACFNRNVGCTALPCVYESDCPAGLSCNDALGVCLYR